MKSLRVFAVLTVSILALGAWAMLHGQNQNQGNGFSSGTFLVTITDSNGNFASNSVITLHSDHSVAVVDSGQEGGPVPFSSQQGVWASTPTGLAARTIDWSFPFATEGSARVDYTFNGTPPNQVAGSIVLTFFAPNQNPLDGGGTPGGNFNFTGTRITVP